MRASELAGVPFLLYPQGTVLRILIDRFFDRIGIAPEVVMEADDTEAIKRLVELRLRLFHHPGTRPAPADAIAQDLSGGEDLIWRRSCLGDGTDGLPAQADPFDRRFAPEALA